MAEAAEDLDDIKGENATTFEERPQTKQKLEATSGKNEGIKRNAFSELMTPKPKQPKLQGDQKMSSKLTPSFNPNDPRAGLLSYIRHPESFPESVVLRVTPESVLIRDMYPKATVHLLLLPRSEAHLLLNPRDAFDDPAFLSQVKSEVASVVSLAASEISRLISPFSASCKSRNEALDSPDPPARLPPGRDFTKDLKVGVHAHPSMNHLHVHILSRDMHSDCVKHRKHYNSFNTDFFIPLEDFPLAKDDYRRSTSVQNANLKKDFVCWRCGRGFGNKFAELKRHLDEEFEQWKRE